MLTALTQRPVLLLLLGCALGAGLLPAAARGDVFGSGLTEFTVEFVDIGNPNNVADITGSPNPAGSVSYVYRIGKYEISEEMIDKANTAGGLGITADLRGPAKPATGVSWNEAARFVNWLNVSSGYAPAYKFALQPGDAGYNANSSIELWNAGDIGYNPANPFRNQLAVYFLPSMDEWYKAAYYDPVTESYYDYPTGSNAAPTGVESGVLAGTAIYGQSLPADITLAGGRSPYGTVGQGGNVYEWEETEFDLVNNSSFSVRGFRGGDWSSAFADSMAATVRDTSGLPTSPNSFVGFRVASIPEPGSWLLLAIGLVCLGLWRRKWSR